MTFTSATALAFALTVTPAVGLAHHGWSAYGDTPQQITGVIREVQFANPHATIQLEAQEHNWLVVLAPPSRMNSRGLPQDSLKVGETATVQGYVHRTNQNELRAEWISLGDTPKQLR
jgi:Family of unknown function (DUF6152)